MTAKPEGTTYTASFLLKGAIRFTMELVALGAVAYWGWQQSDNVFVQLVLAIGLPVSIIALWVIFRTPGDESAAPGKIDTPGPVRLLIEVSTFGFAAFCLWTTVSRAAAETFLTVAALIYFLDWQRVRFLLFK